MKNSARAFAAALLGSSMLIGGMMPLSAQESQEIKLTILGVGDIYNFADNRGRGGVARLNAVALAERAANPNTIYVFDGDMLSPSILSGFDKGLNMIELTSMVPFDIAVPGNHEFDFGVENFMAMMGQSSYPWAAVNITNGDGSPVEGLGGVMMRDIEGLKVALIPVAQDTTPEVTSSGDLQFADTVDSAIAAAEQAEADGAEFIIAVVQTDRANDNELIASGAFDVILSGDDHSYGTYYDGRTAYVETSIDGEFLSPVDIMVTVQTRDDGSRKIRWVPNFRFIDTANVAPDPATQARVEAYQAELDESLNVALGATEGPLDSRRNVVRGEESAMGNLIADALRWATGADVAIANGGGIRGDRTYDAGTVLTRRDILTELPFGNATVVTELPGSQILAAIENGVSQVERGSGRFPQVSGMTYVYDPTAEPGARVQEIMIGGAPLDVNKVYTLATNNYILGGGDGYAALGGGKVLVDEANGNLMANDVMNYIEAMGGVSAKVEGRIKAVGE